MTLSRYIFAIFCSLLPLTSIFAGEQIELQDKELIAQAEQVLKEIVVPEKHFVVCAMRGKSGKIYTGYNLKTTATRASVCAESICLAKALEAKESNICTLVTVGYFTEINGNQQPAFASPCGICRELLYDYAPEVQIIISDQGELKKKKIHDLLRYPYKR